MSDKNSGDKQPWLVPVIVAVVGAISTVAVAWINKPQPSPSPALTTSQNPTLTVSLSPSPTPTSSMPDPSKSTSVATPTLTPTPTPIPALAPIPLEGTYNFQWDEDPSNPRACPIQTSSLVITISPTGLIQSSATPYQFGGKVNPDGTWTASLSQFGHRFKGTIHNGELSGTFTAQTSPFVSQSQKCQGTVMGAKKQS